MNRRAIIYSIFYIFFIGVTKALSLDRSLIIFTGLSLLCCYGGIVLEFSSKITVKILSFILSLLIFPLGLSFIHHFLTNDFLSLQLERYMRWIEFSVYIAMFIYTYVLTGEVFFNQLMLFRLNRHLLTAIIYLALVSIYAGFGEYIYLLSLKTGFNTKTKLLNLIALARESFYGNLTNIAVFSAIEFFLLLLIVVPMIEDRSKL